MVLPALRRLLDGRGAGGGEVGTWARLLGGMSLAAACPGDTAPPAGTCRSAAGPAGCLWFGVPQDSRLTPSLSSQPQSPVCPGSQQASPRRNRGRLAVHFFSLLQGLASLPLAWLLLRGPPFPVRPQKEESEGHSRPLQFPSPTVSLPTDSEARKENPLSSRSFSPTPAKPWALVGGRFLSTGGGCERSPPRAATDTLRQEEKNVEHLFPGQ